MKTLLLMMLVGIAASQLRADDDKPDPDLPAANAMNALGIDLLEKTPPGENALLSPYSIESALAMTCAGAKGKTRDEMAAVLHFPKDADVLHASFSNIQEELQTRQKVIAKYESGDGDTTAADGKPVSPFIVSVANRLYGQEGYTFREPFLTLLKDRYDAPLEPLDFMRKPGAAVKTINDWVSARTHDRIRALIPSDGITPATHMVLVNAIYLKAVWQDKFDRKDTKPDAFHVNGGDASEVPMMYEQIRTYYVKRDGYTAVTLSYIQTSGLHFVVILPDDPKGLPALEAKLTPALLGGLAWPRLGGEYVHPVKIWLPKFKLAPAAMELSKTLETLGMKTAFDDPAESADFDGIAPRKKGDYLCLSAVIHKAFLSLDEDGTEAAGATAAMLESGAAPAPEVPKEIHVDRPFLFAIQDSYSGACFFLGRVTDPR